MDKFGHWDDVPNEEWLAYALRNPHVGTYHVSNPPAGFVDRCSRLAAKHYDHIDHWCYWTSVLGEHNNRGDDGWSRKFPHSHGYDGLTIVYYAQVAEHGGGLWTYENLMAPEGEYRQLEPKVGDYALIFDHEIHGVRAIFGDTPRVTLIASAYPYPKGTGKCRCDKEWNYYVMP